MKSVCITTNPEVLTGMRLSGVDGTLVQDKSQVLFALEAAKNDEDIALVFLCKQASALAEQEISHMKLHCAKPLLLEIPSPGEELSPENSVDKAIRDAIGVG